MLNKLVYAGTPIKGIWFPSPTWYLEYWLSFFVAEGACPRPTLPENVVLSSNSSFLYKSTVSFRCKAGYHLDDRHGHVTNSTCLSNLTWSNEPPRCKSKWYRHYKKKYLCAGMYQGHIWSKQNKSVIIVFHYPTKTAKLRHITCQCVLRKRGFSLKAKP